MSLIDASYFVNDCALPNGTYSNLQTEIARYERDILIQLFGYDLYVEIAAYTSGSDQRIKDIVEGADFTVGNYTVHWNGLLNTEKVSILAYYTFIEYVKNHTISFQNIGTSVSASENASMISAGGLIQRAGVKCRELVGYPGQSGYAPSLYNFMSINITDYPDWIFTWYDPPNMFDL